MVTVRGQAHLRCFKEDTLLLLVAACRAARVLLKRECPLQVAQFLLRLLNQRRIRLLILQISKQSFLLCNLFLQRDRRASARHASRVVVESHATVGCCMKMYAVRP